MKILIILLLTPSIFAQTKRDIIGPKFDPRQKGIIDLKRINQRGKTGSDGGMGGGSRVVGHMTEMDSLGAVSCEESCFVLEARGPLFFTEVSKVKVFVGTDELDEIITREDELIPGEAVSGILLIE
jgi:hypothetical protein